MAHDDAVDQMLSQWRAERPDLDPSTMALFARLTRANNSVNEAIDSALEQYGLRRGEFDVLASLRRSGAPFRLSPGELARALVLSPGAMTNRLNRLASRGLVARRADPKDGRNGEVTLTPRGRRLIDRAVETHVANLDRLVAGVTQADRATLARILRTLEGLSSAQE